jgi:Nif-specific regulatory protein
MQTALLRVLQEGEIKRVGESQTRTVDVRVISATHQDLREMIEGDEFREDLFYRLNTIDISLPPLRHRRGDVPLLAHHFLDRYADREGKDLEGFEAEAMDRLKRYSWPGNVRELEKTVERAVVLARGELITEEDLDLPEEDRRDPFEPGLTLAEVERRVIERTLEDCDGNVSQTARVLDISRRSLHYKLNEWESQDE